MTFQFAHHRPLTPITPVHSPQPSVGSIRSRTPGQLSLHDYRKQQVTPSPPAVPGQRTVKRRFAASSLNKIERIPPDSPNAPLLPPHQYGSTPPLTPSLGPPTPTQLEFSPSKSLLSEDSFPDYLPDLAHLGSSDFNLSPPQSPFFFDAPPSEFNFLPDLLTSPTTPHTQPSFFSLRRKKPSDYTEDHSRSRSGYRAISQTQRLVNLTSVARTSRQSRSTPRKDTRDIRRDTSPLLSVDVPLPEDDYAPLPDGRQYSIYAPLPEDEFAPLPDGRLDSVLHSSRFERRAGAAFQVASANSSSVSPNLGQRQEFGGVRWSEGNQRKIDIVRSRPQTQLSPQRLDQGQQAQREAQPEAHISANRIDLGPHVQPQERFFKPIKRLPHPNVSIERTRKIPPALKLQTRSSFSSSLSHAPQSVTSSSSLSLSKLQFPSPPEAITSLHSKNRAEQHFEFDSQYSGSKSTPKTLHFGGASFDLLNARGSLHSTEIDVPPEDIDTMSYSPTGFTAATERMDKLGVARSPPSSPPSAAAAAKRMIDLGLITQPIQSPATIQSPVTEQAGPPKRRVFSNVKEALSNFRSASSAAVSTDKLASTLEVVAEVEEPPHSFDVREASDYSLGLSEVSDASANVVEENNPTSTIGRIIETYANSDNGIAHERHSQEITWERGCTPLLQQSRERLHAQGLTTPSDLSESEDGEEQRVHQTYTSEKDVLDLIDQCRDSNILLSAHHPSYSNTTNPSPSAMAAPLRISSSNSSSPPPSFGLSFSRMPPSRPLPPTPSYQRQEQFMFPHTQRLSPSTTGISYGDTSVLLSDAPPVPLQMNRQASEWPLRTYPGDAPEDPQHIDGTQDQGDISNLTTSTRQSTTRRYGGMPAMWNRRTSGPEDLRTNRQSLVESIANISDSASILPFPRTSRTSDEWLTEDEYPNQLEATLPPFDFQGGVAAATNNTGISPNSPYINPSWNASSPRENDSKGKGKGKATSIDDVTPDLFGPIHRDLTGPDAPNPQSPNRRFAVHDGQLLYPNELMASPASHSSTYSTRSRHPTHLASSPHPQQEDDLSILECIEQPKRARLRPVSAPAFVRGQTFLLPLDTEDKADRRVSTVSTAWDNFCGRPRQASARNVWPPAPQETRTKWHFTKPVWIKRFRSMLVRSWHRNVTMKQPGHFFALALFVACCIFPFMGILYYVGYFDRVVEEYAEKRGNYNMSGCPKHLKTAALIEACMWFGAVIFGIPVVFVLYHLWH